MDTTGQTTSPTGGTAYHMGDMSLIRFVSSSGVPTEQIWLLDNKKKEMKPFASHQAFLNAFAGNEEAALGAIVNRYATDRAPGGLLNDYEMLDSSYAIQNNGTYKKTEVSKAELSNTYGKPVTDRATQEKMVNNLGLYLSTLKKEKSGLSPSSIDAVVQDPKMVAKYLNAALYGGYSFNDIYRDIKRKELGDAGGSISPISASVPREDYVKTNEGSSAMTNSTTNPPMQIGGIDPNIMDYPIFSLPDDAFKTLVQPLEAGSPEMKAAMDKIQSSAYDIAIKQMEAKTASEKAVADAEWQKFKTDTERTLGVRLGNNAIDAWKQVEGLREQFSEKGISGSGIQNESIDDYLQSVRRADKNNKDETLSAVDAKKAAYYRSSASSEEIAALTPEEKQKYGLTVSENLRKSLSFDTLKKMYPDLSDEKINRLRSSIIDENDNLRSTIYQNQVKSNLETVQSKEDYQSLQVEKAAAAKAKVAGKEFIDEEQKKKEGTFFARDTNKINPPKDTTPIDTLNTNIPAKTQEQAPASPEYANGLQPNDPRNQFNTATGAANPNYKPAEGVVSTPKDLTTLGSKPMGSTPVVKTSSSSITIPKVQPLKQNAQLVAPIVPPVKTPTSTPQMATSTPQAPISSLGSQSVIGMPTRKTTSSPKNQGLLSSAFSKVKSFFGK